MNGNIKFHKPESPAFDHWQEWVSACGHSVHIIKVVRWGTGKWDATVTYCGRDMHPMEKDAWNFQVRYQHVADKNIRKKTL